MGWYEEPKGDNALVFVSDTLRLERNHRIGGYDIKLRNGLLVWIGDIPIEDKPDQLSIFINTEEMPDIAHNEGGEPYIQVVLNDATLYDKERPA